MIGPVARYIKVDTGKAKYAAIAKKALGRGMLDRFVVTSDEDRQVLQKNRQEAGCKSDCGILQTKNSPSFSIMPFNVDGGRVEVERVCSVLNVDNDLIFNVLIDNARIDRVAL